MCAQRRQISLGILPVWSESSLSVWRKLGYLATHWAHSEDSDQTGGCPGWSEFSLCAYAILLVLSCASSNKLHWAQHFPWDSMCAQRRFRSACGSKSSLCFWRHIGSLVIDSVPCEDADQTARCAGCSASSQGAHSSSFYLYGILVSFQSSFRLNMLMVIFPLKSNQCHKWRRPVSRGQDNSISVFRVVLLVSCTLAINKYKH